MGSLRRIATQFPQWTLGQCRAYRAGARAGIREAGIKEGFEYDPDDPDSEEDLTRYFFRGYADAMGPDAEGEDWFEEISDWTIAYRWWA